MLIAAVRPHLLSGAFALAMAIAPAVLALGQSERLLIVMLGLVSLFGVLRVLCLAWRVRLDFLPPERADRELAWLLWAKLLRELGFAAAMIVSGLAAMIWGEPTTAALGPKISGAGGLYLLIVGWEWLSGEYAHDLSGMPISPPSPPPPSVPAKPKPSARPLPAAPPPRTPTALRRPTPAASAPPPPMVPTRPAPLPAVLREPVLEKPAAAAVPAASTRASTEAPPNGEVIASAAPAAPVRASTDTPPSEQRELPARASTEAPPSGEVVAPAVPAAPVRASTEAPPNEQPPTASDQRPTTSSFATATPDPDPQPPRAEPAHKTLSRAELRSAIAADGGVEKFVANEAARLGITVTERPPPTSRLRTRRSDWKARRDAKRAQRIAAGEAAAAQAAAQHRERLISAVPFAGRGVSGGLSRQQPNADRLRAAGLPVLGSAEDVADFLGVTVRKLHWLTFHREAADSTHYVYFAVPKKAGGERIICAPKPHMRAAQQRVLDGLLSRVAVDAAAHGFVPGRSIVSNAAAHVGREVVVNLDLRDFFPSITFPRVRGAFVSLGYSEAAATLLALLCTECPRKRVRFTEGAAAGTAGAASAASSVGAASSAETGKSAPQFWVAVGDRQLPQGAVTSPALTNIVCRDLDRRLTALAARLGGWSYTRYADDLSFSGGDPTGRAVGELLAEVRGTLRFAGFALHPDKVRVQRSSSRQSVTGLAVNAARPSVSRGQRRRLRAVLHNAARTGLSAQNRSGHAHFADHVRGWAAFIGMVDRSLGDKMLTELDQLSASPTALGASKSDGKADLG